MKQEAVTIEFLCYVCNGEYDVCIEEGPYVSFFCHSCKYSVKVNVEDLIK